MQRFLKHICLFFFDYKAGDRQPVSALVGAIVSVLLLSQVVHLKKLNFALLFLTKVVLVAMVISRLHHHYTFLLQFLINRS